MMEMDQTTIGDIVKEVKAAVKTFKQFQEGLLKKSTSLQLVVQVLAKKVLIKQKNHLIIT